MKKLDRSSFGDTLYKAMDAKGLSAKDVADYMDVSVQAVHAWINGTKLPMTEKTVTLAYLLGIKMDELFPSVDAEWDGVAPNGAAIEKKLRKGE